MVQMQVRCDLKSSTSEVAVDVEQGRAESRGTRELSSNLSCLLQTFDNKDQEPMIMTRPASKYKATWEPPLQETSLGNPLS